MQKLTHVGLKKVHPLPGGGLSLEPERQWNNPAQNGSQTEAAGDLIVKFARWHLLLLLTQELGQELR